MRHSHDTLPLSSEQIGSAGERTAAAFLRSRGYRIIGRNVRTPFGEIDIICKKNGDTVFVEVKARVSDRFGPPLASITGEKCRRLLRNCLYYMQRNGLSASPCRIDAVGIFMNEYGDCRVLQHVRNAVQLD